MTCIVGRNPLKELCNISCTIPNLIAPFIVYSPSCERNIYKKGSGTFLATENPDTRTKSVPATNASDCIVRNDRLKRVEATDEFSYCV